MPFIQVIDYDTVSTFTDGGYGPVNNMDISVTITLETQLSTEITMETQGYVTATTEVMIGVTI
jgi:hypothetical protein